MVLLREHAALAHVFARRNFWLLVIVYVPMLAVYGGSDRISAARDGSRSQPTDCGRTVSLLNCLNWWLR